MRDCGDLFFFFRRQIVKILVHGAPGVNAVLNTVKTRQEHRGKRKVGIGSRIGETHLNAPRFWITDIRDAAGR